MLFFRVPLLALLASSFAAAAHGGVFVVDPQGQPGIAFLTNALNAAVDGDIVLVKSGTYADPGPIVIDGKGITIVNDSGGPLSLPAFVVKNVPLDSTFALRGFKIPASGWHPALTAEPSLGTIWLEDCMLEGGKGVTNSPFMPPTDGQSALAAQFVGGLVIERCVVVGGQGVGDAMTHYVSAGGLGCDVASSAVAIHDSSIVGGINGKVGFPSSGGAGGSGLAAAFATVLVAGSTIRGGDSQVNSFSPGVGLVATNAIVRLRNSTVSSGIEPNGQAAPAIFNNGATVTTSSTMTRSIDVSSPVRSGQLVTLNVHGVANDVALILLGSPAPPVENIGFEGSFVFGLGAFIGPVVFGTIPANGVLTVTVLTAPLPPGIDGATAVVQAAVASGTLEAATLYVQVGPNF